ncbi:5436_t:CDS:2, partial [Paraglomus occultum]
MNNQCLIVRYGELFLKGKNRDDFVQKLVVNVNLTLQKNNFSDFNVKKLHDQLIITTKNDKELSKMIIALSKVFGISAFFLAYQLENDCKKLYDFVEKIADYYEIDFPTFKFDVSRSDKNFPKNSLTLQKELGEIVVKKQGLKKVKGLGGLPVGSSGKVLLLLSGGIDSPVAAYQLMKRGLEVVYCHFYHQKEAKKLAISALATGDALAQVASQTIESLNVISQ